MNWEQVYGFNYQPSYGRTVFEIWRKFDAATIQSELERGKRHFPALNAIRWWLSWDAFLCDPAAFARDFEIALTLAARLDLRVMPVLFNRWHDSVLDYGGLYIDHFLPGASWVQSAGMFDAFLEAIVGAHARDERIFCWDLCNEPYAYGLSPAQLPDIEAAETLWLQKLYDSCKQLGAQAPITVGVWSGTSLETVNAFSDVLSVHPYWDNNQRVAYPQGLSFEQLLDGYVAFAQTHNKPLIASETCWGSVNDATRVEFLRHTLGALSERNIGSLSYVLHHSLTIDAHRPEYGPLNGGNFSFIEADGSLRPGHGIWNEFAG